MRRNLSQVRTRGGAQRATGSSSLGLEAGHLAEGGRADDAEGDPLLGAPPDLVSREELLAGDVAEAGLGGFAFSYPEAEHTLVRGPAADGSCEPSPRVDPQARARRAYDRGGVVVDDDRRILRRLVELLREAARP